jgi:hypothetical protein
MFETDVHPVLQILDVEDPSTKYCSEVPHPVISEYLNNKNTPRLKIV